MVLSWTAEEGNASKIDRLRCRTDWADRGGVGWDEGEARVRAAREERTKNAAKGGGQRGRRAASPPSARHSGANHNTPSFRTGERYILSVRRPQTDDEFLLLPRRFTNNGAHLDQWRSLHDTGRIQERIPAIEIKLWLCWTGRTHGRRTNLFDLGAREEQRPWRRSCCVRMLELTSIHAAVSREEAIKANWNSTGISIVRGLFASASASASHIYSCPRRRGVYATPVGRACLCIVFACGEVQYMHHVYIQRHQNELQTAFMGLQCG